MQHLTVRISDGRIDRVFEVADVPLAQNDRVILMNSVSSIYAAVKSGAGIAVLPKYMIAGNPEIEVILPASAPEPVEMYFVYPEERRHSRRISVFRDFLLERVALTDF